MKNTLLAVLVCLTADQCADPLVYNALLKMWLGPRPAQDDLKDALLGKPL